MDDVVIVSPIFDELTLDAVDIDPTFAPVTVLTVVPSDAKVYAQAPASEPVPER